jgi:hypothetical protein
MVTKLTLHDDWRDLSQSSFSERDVDVLDLISMEALTRFTFDGLKRRLGIHPETLSRILNRLEQEGFVEKGPEGYKVTSKINDYATPRSVNDNKDCAPLLQTFIPSNVSIDQLVQSLRGKWFGMLRWFGFAEDEEGITLKWITEDGGIQVNANISETSLAITAKFLRENNLNTALTASYQLMTTISRLCQRKQFIRHVGYYGDYGLFLTPA